jgi:hypothetical protein
MKLYIELKEIDKNTLKVGDVVGIARPVRTGYHSQFRHLKIYQATITRITPKRTKITTDKFGDHDRHEKFYEYNYNAEKENALAEEFCQIRDGVYDLYEFKRQGLNRISDEDFPEVAEHMKAITEILKKYKE